MKDLHEVWLIAKRELRERSRSRAFIASVVVMVVAVIAAVALPAFLNTTARTKHVGLAGAEPADLEATFQAQGRAVGTDIRIHRYDTVAAGEQAVRDDK